MSSPTPHQRAPLMRKLEIYVERLRIAVAEGDEDDVEYYTERVCFLTQAVSDGRFPARRRA